MQKRQCLKNSKMVRISAQALFLGDSHTSCDTDYDPEFGMGDHMFRDLALSCDAMAEYHACLGPERAIEQKLTTNSPTTEFLAVLFRANMRN
jgi:hypothetical protein